MFGLVNKYLINEMPLTVQPTLARMFGLEKAVIIQQIHYALQQPKSGKILDDGQKWLWNTYAEWQETYFTWLSVDMVKRYFLQLEKDEILISCQPNKSKFDQTKFYQINYKVLVDLIDKSSPNDSDEKSRSDGDEKSRSDGDEKSRSLKEQIILTNNSTNNSFKENILKSEFSNENHETFSEQNKFVDNSNLNTQAKEIFDYWQITLNHPRVKFSNDKKYKIINRLKEGFTVTELKQAIDGNKLSEFHQGNNADGRRYNSIGLIFRNSSKTEDFIQIATNFNEVKNNGNNNRKTDNRNGNSKTTQEPTRLTTAEYLESIGAKPKSIVC